MPVTRRRFLAASAIALPAFSYAATLQLLFAPDRDGRRADLLLGYDDAADYTEHGGYFGVTIGLYANRIAGGRKTARNQRVLGSSPRASTIF